MRLKQPLWVLCGSILLASVLLYGIGSVLLYEKLSHLPPGYRGFLGNTPGCFTHFSEEISALDARPYFMPQYQAIYFPSRTHGITLSGWWIPGRKTFPAIIIVHGYLTSKADPRVLMMASLLHRHGFNTLVLDLRDNGASTIEDSRSSLGTKEYLDVLGAKDWLVRQGFSPEAIGLAGGSMGAATVLIAFQKDPHFKAVFSDSSYASLVEAVKEELKHRHYSPFFAYGGILAGYFISGDKLWQESPLNAMDALSGRAVMLVHSTADPVVSFWHPRQLINKALKNNQVQVQTWFHTLPGHCNAILLETPLYESKLISFFEGAFKTRDIEKK